MGEHCLVLGYPNATSGDGVTKEPHLSPQHYELNAIQHVLDRTRVSVCNAANKLGGSRCADLTARRRSVPSLFHCIAQNKAQTSSPKGGREGGKNFTKIVY